MVRDHMPEQHRELFGKLPFVHRRQPGRAAGRWASMLMGPPGFMRTPDCADAARSMRARWRRDPLAREPGGRRADRRCSASSSQTRRRNRMNGRGRARTHDGFGVRGRQSFGNCPQVHPGARTRAGSIRRGRLAVARPAQDARSISAAAARWCAAPTRSSSPAPRRPARRSRGARGRRFAPRRQAGLRARRRRGRRTLLTAPDFAGNNLFNTLGNLALDPRAGLLFIDFARGDRLHMRGGCQRVVEGDELDAFAGAQRLVRFRVREVLRISGAPRLAWSEPLASPLLQATGSWPGQQG